ncbi:MAG: TPM domain-containing protein [Parcubacteria group bacterium]
MFKKVTIAFCLMFLFAFNSHAYYSPGTPTGFVNDYANLMTPASRASLESELTQFEQATKHEIAVVTINSLQGDTIENFAVKLFEDWKIGKQGADNGVLFLISKEDRQMRIEVGYGLEGALTDIQSSAIIDQLAKPNFQQNNFDQGIYLSVSEIEKVIQGEPISVNVEKKNSGLIDPHLIFWLVIILFSVWRAIFFALGKSKSWWQGGVVGAVIGAILGVIFWGAIGSVVVGIILAGFGLFSDWGASHRDWFKKGGRGGGLFFGGGFGGKGGGGFGGFGGGRSGGGGASGSW